MIDFSFSTNTSLRRKTFHQNLLNFFFKFDLEQNEICSIFFCSFTNTEKEQRNLFSRKSNRNCLKRIKFKITNCFVASSINQRFIASIKASVAVLLIFVDVRVSRVLCSSKYSVLTRKTHFSLKIENLRDFSFLFFLKKIADFGLAKKLPLSREQTNETMCGTPNYISP